MLSCEFCEIVNNTFFIENLRVAVSQTDSIMIFSVGVILFNEHEMQT